MKLTHRELMLRTLRNARYIFGQRKKSYPSLRQLAYGLGTFGPNQTPEQDEENDRIWEAVQELVKLGFLSLEPGSVVYEPGLLLWYNENDYI